MELKKFFLGIFILILLIVTPLPSKADDSAKSPDKVILAEVGDKKITRQEQNDKEYEINKTKKDIAWGSQIRSYVLHPYKMAKDHRTNLEVGNVTRVLDGDLDDFIEAYLLQCQKCN